MISAASVQFVTRALGDTGAILLRGRDSILAGEPQNDIDLYFPTCVGDVQCVLRKLDVVEIHTSAPQQYKALVKVTETNEIVVLDIFYEVAWRGLPMQDLGLLPKKFCKQLGTQYLERESAAWLTVLKNALHASPTPPHKLQEVKGSPHWPVTVKPNFGLVRSIDKWLAETAWSVARFPEKGKPRLVQIRLAFLILCLFQAPVRTPFRVFGWVFYKLRHRFYS